MVAQSYNSLLQAGKTESDPEVKKAHVAAQHAWDSYLGVAGKYTMPDESKKPKGVKQKVEHGLGQMFGHEGIEPHMLPAASLQILKNSAPPGLGLTPEDRAAMSQQAYADEQLKGLKEQTKQAGVQFTWLQDAEKRKQRQLDLTTKDPSTLTLPERQELSGMQRMAAFEKDPVNGVAKMELMKKIMSGQQLSDGERQMAVAEHMIEGPHIEVRTTGIGNDEIVTMDPTNGKVLSRTLLGKHWTDNTALSNQLALLTQQSRMRYDELLKGGATSEQAYRIMAEENSRHPEFVDGIINGNPVQKATDFNAVSGAISKVFKDIKTDPARSGSSKPNPKDAMREELFKRLFVVPDDPSGNGPYAFRGAISPTGIKNEFSGGQFLSNFLPNGQPGKSPFTTTTMYGKFTRKDIEDATAEAYRRVRSELQVQGKGKYTESDLDRMVPPSYATPQGWNIRDDAKEMTAPPGSAQAMSSPPAGFSPTKPMSYRITVNGQTQQYDNVSPEQYSTMQAQGVQLEPIQ
jgi:hypothetical protein